MIKIVTDTSCDLTKDEAEKQGIIMMDIPVMFGEETFEGNNDEFYDRLSKAKKLPTTCQVTPTMFEEVFEKAKKAGETLLVLPISSKISGSYNSACVAQQQGNFENVHVVDSLSTVSQLRMLVVEANKAKDKMSIEELKKYVLDLRGRVRLWAYVDTLEYLMKGGRVSKAAGILGGLLKIKPVISIVDGFIRNVDRGKGIKGTFDIIKEKIEKEPIDYDFPVYFQYSGNDSGRGSEFVNTVSENPEADLKNLGRIGPVVGTHVGPNATAITYIRKGDKHFNYK